MDQASVLRKYQNTRQNRKPSDAATKKKNLTAEVMLPRDRGKKRWGGGGDHTPRTEHIYDTGGRSMELSTCCIRRKRKWNAILVCNDLRQLAGASENPRSIA